MPRPHASSGQHGRRGMRFALGQANAAMLCRFPSPSMGEGQGGGDELTRVFPPPLSSPARREEQSRTLGREGEIIMTHARMWVGAVVVVGLLVQF